MAQQTAMKKTVEVDQIVSESDFVSKRWKIMFCFENKSKQIIQITIWTELRKKFDWVFTSKGFY